MLRALTNKQLPCAAVGFPRCHSWGRTPKACPSSALGAPAEELRMFPSLMLLFSLWNSERFGYSDQNTVSLKAR